MWLLKIIVLYKPNYTFNESGSEVTGFSNMVAKNWQLRLLQLSKLVKAYTMMRKNGVHIYFILTMEHGNQIGADNYV